MSKNDIGGYNMVYSSKGLLEGLSQVVPLFIAFVIALDSCMCFKHVLM